MGSGCFGFILVMAFFLEPLACQPSQQQLEPNSDGFFVSGFLKKMGSSSSSFSQIYNFSDPFCSWPGVFCDAKKEHVIELAASGSGLSGSIPDTTIGKLTKLQNLDLSNNKITGLPADLWSLGTLKSLNLSSNQISGSLPNNIGNFGLLERLDISSNNFSGAIPETIGSLVSLQILKLGRNGFDQSIPTGILSCQSLVTIDLSSNQLSGSLPDGFGAAFPKLKTLNLAGNEIHGRDSDFLELKSITTLNVSSNLFQGSAMGMFKELLEVIDLSRNQFQGHISQVQFNTSYNWARLVYLDLSENELSGDILHNFNQSQNLRHLNLAYNRFSRQEFPKIEMLSSLEYLNFSSTSLIGQVPAEMSQLSNLNTLDLSENHLVGHIPLLSVKKLQILDVSHNNLTGDIPASLLHKVLWMERFNFSYNNLTLCASEIPLEAFKTAFIGSLNSCPIAANPALFKRSAPKHKGLRLALALALSMVCLLAGLLFLAFGCRRRNRLWAVKQTSYKEEQTISGPFSFQTDSTTWVADVKQATSVPVVIFEKPLLNITFADLLSATSNFDRGTLLAEGKFGPVYRGFLPGGIHVAVKVLVHGSTLTDQEAARELEYLGRIKHPNLVPLTGYCLAGDQRLAIYDYMENGNLQNLLHDLPLGVQTTEDWSTDTWEEDENNGIQNVGSEGLLTTWRFRHKIALGTARALAFLHHGCFPSIIHRDVKASSVYLDYSLEPRLSDFGLAKIFGNGLDEELACGSPGYVPPEFSNPDIDSPTSKSDVYCFGVVLFELITGKKPIEDDYPEEKEATLVGWVRGLIRKNKASRAIDPKICDTGPEEQMVEALKIGYLCTADLPSKRPSMQQIVGLLKDIESTGNQ
ncbi:Tyrosine-protein kinase [Trema orientale]|uniref:Tyrosine-protein kinase n=1 Tax=Trema orientale TaxID=63057 RepID=A0A2P5F3A4_TREOI|nr:Tyrosine-protein kinase [Trema orientale]